MCTSYGVRTCIVHDGVKAIICGPLHTPYAEVAGSCIASACVTGHILRLPLRPWPTGTPPLHRCRAMSSTSAPRVVKLILLGVGNVGGAFVNLLIRTHHRIGPPTPLACLSPRSLTAPSPAPFSFLCYQAPDPTTCPTTACSSTSLLCATARDTCTARPSATRSCTPSFHTKPPSSRSTPSNPAAHPRPPPCPSLSSWWTPTRSSSTARRRRTRWTRSC